MRVGVRFNRSIDSEPFSHDLGRICAGLAAAPKTANALHAVDSQDDVDSLKASFPVVDRGYPVYFTPDI